jgi:hypothetical protein
MTTTTLRRRGDPKIFKSADGRWTCFIELPPGADGARRRRKISAATKVDAIERRKEAEKEPDDGTPDRISIGAAVEEWLAGRADVVSDRTLVNYTHMVKAHVRGTAVAKKKLKDLTARDVEALLRAKKDSGLSPRTTNLIRTILRASIEQANQRGIVTRNVVKQTHSFREP